MALLERLEILIDADGKAARSEFESIGRSAEKELGRAEDRTAKMSARLQTIGTGALVGGAVAVGALGLLAKASDDADKQVLNLENSIKNSDQAFRNKGKALRDVAQDLQKVTAADADAVIGSQSLLVQFGLTERQIVAVRQDKLLLETEFETRANQQQLRSLNDVEFGYQAPTAEQYLAGERQLAMLGKPRAPDAPSPIRVASAAGLGDEDSGFPAMVSPLTGKAMAAEAPRDDGRKPVTAATLAKRLGEVEPREERSQ